MSGLKTDAKFKMRWAAVFFSSALAFSVVDAAATSKATKAAKTSVAARPAKLKSNIKSSRFKPLAPAPSSSPIQISTIVSDEDKLNAVLKFVFDNEAQKHGWPANYKTLWCPTNIFNLLRRLEQARVDLAKANVWYILPAGQIDSRGESVVHPKAARQGPTGEMTDWAFHVVLEIEGRILDLDFTDHPKVVSMADYGAKMWQKGPLATGIDEQPLFARVIPAREYLASYYGNWTWYSAGGGGRYAAVDFKSLLGKR